MRDYANNLTMLVDFYELTMMNGYLNKEMDDKIAYFDYYFRSIPDNAGFAITCGLHSFIDYVENLEFKKENIEYLRSKNIFSEEFLKKLEKFKFTGDIWAMPEGTPVFPNEPIISVRAEVFQAQLIETALLLFLNHQSLISTKANRIVRASEGKAVTEFGARRAQGVDASVLGARAAYIGGCIGSSNVLADEYLGVPASGTMAHSWIQMFNTEYDAFKAYAEVYPDSTTLLVDTYNVLKSGIPNAIRVFDEVLKPLGKRPVGIRLDSGDIAYLSKHSRQMLDEAGYEDCKIVVSNSLDEYLIRDLNFQDAQIDVYGVGERLITSKSSPVLGGVYKLVGVEENGVFKPKIKLSENVEKITTPGFKQVWRLFDRDNGMMIADQLTLFHEIIDDEEDLEIFNPKFTWKRQLVENYVAKPMLQRIYDCGVMVYDIPELESVRDYCIDSVNHIWEEVKRFENPHIYYVDLSQELWDLKQGMITDKKIL